MFSRFENLSEEKKKRIIDACIEEFSRNGYTNASTNDIVRNAQISKGLLFHYFKSKKNLYLYVFDHVAGFLSEKILKNIDELPADFFERIMKIGLIKLQTAYEHPSMYRFIVEAVTHTPDEVRKEVQKRYEKMYLENMLLIYKNIDTSKFRKDIDKEKALELIIFALEGVSGKYQKIFKNMDVHRIMAELENIAQDYYKYIDILKNGVYENPGQG